MKILRLFKSIALALGCAVLAMTSIPVEAGVVKGHAGTTFTLAPAGVDDHGNPRFTHTVDGVVRVSSLGNCTFHADVIAILLPDGSFSLAGTFRITSADGETTLDAGAVGVFTGDPANPAFGNFHYSVTITGGTGQMESARGKADVDGFAMFTEPDLSKGKATWSLFGNIATHP